VVSVVQVEARVNAAHAAAPPGAVSAGAAAVVQAAADAAQAAAGAAQAAQAAADAAQTAVAAAQAAAEATGTTAASAEAAATARQAAAAARQAEAAARQAAAAARQAEAAARQAAVTAAAMTPAPAAASSSAVESFEHKPYLVGVHCDSPARQKMACWLGVAAYLACGWCLFHAERLASASGKEHVYPKGYRRPVEQPHLTPQGEPAQAAAGARLRVKVGDQLLQLTDTQQRQRAMIVLKAGLTEAAARADNAARRAARQPVVPLPGPSKQEVARQQGCNGLSAIPDIEYVSYSNIWVAPVIHMLLYGVVAEFLRQLLGTKNSKRKQAADKAAREGDDAAVAAAAVGAMSSAGKKVAAQRAADVQLTSDFGRPYKDVTNYLGSFKMEDYLHFVETFSLYIFRGDVSLLTKL